MAELSTISRPYARAAFESARAAGSLSQWSAALARAAAVVKDRRVAALIGNPRVQPSELTRMIFELATGALAEGRATGERGAKARGGAESHGARLRTELRNFLDLLAHNRRLPLLPGIATQFDSLRADAENFATVEVRSARELTPQQLQRLQQALEQRLRRSVRLHTRIDPELIGGAVVQYGDFVVDGSLRRALERMGAKISGA